MTDRELMQMALDALELMDGSERADGIIVYADDEIKALRNRLAQPEPEPVAYVSGYYGGHCVVTPMNPAVVFSVGTAFSYTTPVHAIDISQERVDETAKREHKWVGLDGDIPGLGLVTEEFYNGMIFAEDILREKNT